MGNFAIKNKANHTYIVIISILIPLIYLILSRNISLSLADEGFLWEGTLSTVDGLVPIRDFQAYDPFRYYFSSLFVLIFGRGIISIQISMAVLQCVGIYCLLSFVDKYSTNKHGKLSLLLVAGIVMQWFAVYFKTTDTIMPIFSIIILTWMFNSKVSAKFLWSGVFTGFSAFIGKNHGLYNLIIFTAAILVIYFLYEHKSFFKKVGGFCIGIILGYSPMLLMFLFVPGFLKSFYSTIIGMAARGSTNITRPVPWPWTVDLSAGNLIWNILTGLFFIAVPILYGVVLILFFRALRNNTAASVALFSSAWVGMIYLHYAFSRADIDHISFIVMPLIITLCLMISSFRHQIVQLGFIILLVIYSYFTITISLDRLFLNTKDVYPYAIKIESEKNEIMVNESTYAIVSSVQSLDGKYHFKDGEVLFMPYIPGLYAVMGLHSPVYDTYILHVAIPEKQIAMIRDLQQNNTRYIIYSDSLVDGREDLAFNIIYPDVSKYISDNYVEIEAALPDTYHMLIKRNGDL